MSHDVTSMDVMIFSVLFQVPLNELLRHHHRQSLRVDSNTFKMLIVRQACSLIGWVSIYQATPLLPIGYIQLIQNLIPFITLIASVLVLREHFDCVDFGINATILVCLSTVTAMKLT